jgi:hypothetical protein
MPFEVLMARLNELNRPLARQVALVLTRISVANALHHQMATLLHDAAAAGGATRIVTTNYDTGISLGCQDLIASGAWSPALPLPGLVVRQRDVGATPSPLEIFHIHGCTTDSATLVLDYKEEFKLAAWKQRHLADLIPGATLLVIGFSGWDLDVSKAVSDHAVRNVVWLRRDQRECEDEAWSEDAKAVMGAAIGDDWWSRVQVNTDGDLCHALAGLAEAPAECLRTDHPHIEERYRELADLCSASGSWFKLWARWTALRAGFGEVAECVPPEEQRLLSESSLLDMAAFNSYYTGRHRTGARQQRLAAKAALRHGEPFDRYVYFRNNQVEYLNRGAYTGSALIATIQTVAEILHHR